MANLNSDSFNKVERATQEIKNKGIGLDGEREDMSERAMNKANALATDWSQTATRYSQTGLDYIRENPAKGAAIAAISGWAVGNLLTMALRSRK